MGTIDDIYADLDTDISEEEFREAVEEKVEQMGGLADEETAAMLIAHELTEDEVNNIADIEPGMREVQFLGKVVSIGELRTFDREGEGDDAQGHVINVMLADETGRVRVSFWDERASAAEAELEPGQVLRIEGRPSEGYEGVEVSVDQVEPAPDVDIDVQVQDVYRIEDLSLGLSDVNLRGRVLDTESVRTFSRDDGSEGRVANLVLGDETGRIRVTLWDEQADLTAEFTPGESVEVVDGYVRERDGDIELHVGHRGTIESIDEDIEYVPDATDIADVEIGQTVDLAGVVRSADPKRTFTRDDDSEGQVRNIRLQDETGDIRVALWGEKADKELAPGDRVQFTDVEIRDGWQDELEASAGWRSTVAVLANDEPSGDTGSFAPDTAVERDVTPSAEEANLDAFSGENESVAPAADVDTESDDVPTDGDFVEFTGVVVQAGDPIVLDDGTETVSVEGDMDVELGQELTVSGTFREGRIDPEDSV